MNLVAPSPCVDPEGQAASANLTESIVPYSVKMPDDFSLAENGATTEELIPRDNDGARNGMPKECNVVLSVGQDLNVVCCSSIEPVEDSCFLKVICSSGDHTARSKLTTSCKLDSNASNIDCEMELDRDDALAAKEAPRLHEGAEWDHDYTECSPMNLGVPSPCVDQAAQTASLMENTTSLTEKADTADGRIKSHHSSTEEIRPILSEEQDTEGRIEFDTNKLSSSEGVSNIGNEMPNETNVVMSVGQGTIEDIKPIEDTYNLNAICCTSIEPVEDLKVICSPSKPTMGSNLIISCISSSRCTSNDLNCQSKSDNGEAAVDRDKSLSGETSSTICSSEVNNCTPATDSFQESCSCYQQNMLVQSIHCRDQMPQRDSSRDKKPSLAYSKLDSNDSLCTEVQLTSTEGPNIDSEMELDTDDESTAKEAPLSHLGSECDHDYRSTECSPMTLAVPSPCVDQEARTANLMENAASSIEKADTAVGRIRSNHSSTEERRPVLSEEQDTEDRIEFDTKLSSSEGVSNIGTNNSVHKSRTNTSSKAHLKNLVPFTEEWLAVMEAFGEEVLEQKSGAVQNSPTDKAAPEPSPWSPVKRKFQDVGPFDCTKYSKIVGAIHHEMVLLVVLLGILLEADPVCGIVGVGEAEPELEGLRGALPLPASVLPGLRGVLAGEHPRGQLHRGDDGGVGDVVGAARLPFTAHGAQHGEDVVDAAGVHVALHQRGVHTRVGRVRLGKQRHRHVLFFFRRVDDDVVQQMRVGHLLIVVVVVIRLCSEQGADVEASVAHGLDDGLCGGDVAEADVGGDEGVEGGVGHGGRRAVGGGSLEVVEDGVEEAERACRWKARDGGSVGAAVGEEVTAAAEHGVGEVGVVGTGGGEGEGVGVQQVEVAAGAEALEKEELE
uniref:Uncharacterized protein n=2 Tax=Leersia perrieri TaxID=77586 RepID=A0A0D9XN40_9ORYZ